MAFFKLRDELINDPTGQGYAAMSDGAAAAAVNAKVRDHWVPLSASQVFEAIDPTEFRALTAAAQVRVDRILGLGDGIETAPGSQARAELVAVFGAGSSTIANLVAIANQKISRGEEIGFGTVRESDVAFARSL